MDTPDADGLTQSMSEETSHERLERLCQWCLNGRLIGAELELVSWFRCEDCPADAQVLLASIMAQRGQYEDALNYIRRPRVIENSADDLAAKSLIALLVSCDLKDTARAILAQLHSEHGHERTTQQWVDIMQMPGTRHLPETVDVSVDHLASQLTVELQVIPSLVAAQKIESNEDEIQLLRDAIGRVMPDVGDDSEQMHTLCVAMAELAMLVKDGDDARRWAHRGLGYNRYSASLALVLAQVADDEAVGPPAAKVLSRVSKTYPQYPDVRAAMIRRHNDDGLVESARLELAQWLEDQPDNAIAQNLQKELAA